jgi:hypothetical protein
MVHVTQDCEAPRLSESEGCLKKSVFDLVGDCTCHFQHFRRWACHVGRPDLILSGGPQIDNVTVGNLQLGLLVALKSETDPDLSACFICSGVRHQ